MISYKCIYTTFTTIYYFGVVLFEVMLRCTDVSELCRNYKSELYAFGQRLSEDFDEQALRIAFTDRQVLLVIFLASIAGYIPGLAI